MSPASFLRLDIYGRTGNTEWSQGGDSITKQKIIPLTLHLPDTEEGLARLARKRAAVHVGLILSRVQALPCSKGTKKRLLEAVKADAVYRLGPVPGN